MANGFVGVFDRLEFWGITDALLPFLLIFTVIFAVLQKTKLLGQGNKNFNVVIALVIALLVVIPHVAQTYPPDRDVVEILNNAIPGVSLIIVAIVMLILLVGVWGVEVNWVGGTVTGWIALLSFLAVVYIFGSAGRLWETTSWLWWIGDPNTQATILVILVFAILVWFITKEPRSTTGDSFFKKLGDFFSKPK